MSPDDPYALSDNAYLRLKDKEQTMDWFLFGGVNYHLISGLISKNFIPEMIFAFRQERVREFCAVDDGNALIKQKIKGFSF